MKIWTQLSFVLSQIARLTDRQTDGRRDSFIVTRPRCMQCMQRGKYCKITIMQLLLRCF